MKKDRKKVISLTNGIEKRMLPGQVQAIGVTWFRTKVRGYGLKPTWIILYIHERIIEAATISAEGIR